MVLWWGVGVVVLGCWCWWYHGCCWCAGGGGGGGGVDSIAVVVAAAAAYGIRVAILTNCVFHFFLVFPRNFGIFL